MVTDKELWRDMETLANEERSFQREMKFMLLLKEAYDKDRDLIMACVYDPEMPGMEGQAYMDVMDKRMIMCFTSEQRAEEADYNVDWDDIRWQRCRDHDIP